MLSVIRLPHYLAHHLRLEMKELYFATAIMDMAAAAMLIFEPIYLNQQLGLSVTAVLLFFAAVYALYTLLLPLAGYVITGLGCQRAIAVSILWQILYWACLYAAVAWPMLVVLAPFFYALQKIFYWPAFHSLVARYAHRDQVAREFGLLSAIVQVVQIIGPLLGGVVAAVYGGQALLVFAAAVNLLALLPLLLFRSGGSVATYKWQDTWNFYKTETRHALGYFGFGEELLALTIWPLFIYFLTKGYGVTGAVVTMAALLAALLSLYVGRLTDGQARMKLLGLGAFLTGIVWVLRPLFPGLGGALAADSVARAGKNVYFIPLSTVTYKRAEVSGILPYVIFFEQSLSVGKMLTALAAAVLFALTGSFPLLFILAGLISLLFLLL